MAQDQSDKDTGRLAPCRYEMGMIARLQPRPPEGFDWFRKWDMWRLGYFWSGLSLSAKLQYLAMGLLLGYTFYRIDLNNRFMGAPMWQVTLSLIAATFVLGRLLLPLLMLNPMRSQRLLSWFGMLIFLLGLYTATQPWRGKKIVHLALNQALWLDVSCWFWLISEIQMRLARPALASAGPDDDNDELNSDDKDDGR